MGAGVTLSGSASDFPSGASLTFAWDVNNDGSFDDDADGNLDITGSTHSLSWDDLASISAPPAGGGWWLDIGLQVTDQFNNTAFDTAPIELPDVLDASADAGGDPVTGAYAAAWSDTLALTLTGTASGFPSASSLTFAWDLNADGWFDDDFDGNLDTPGATQTLSWDDLVSISAPPSGGGWWVDVGFQVTDQFGHTAYDSASIELPAVMDASADAGGDAGTDIYNVAYNSSLTLSGSASGFPSNSALTFAWDLNNDGLFDDDADGILDASGATQTVFWNQLTAISEPPAGGGWWFDVGMQVTDQFGNTAYDSASIELPTELTVWAVGVAHGTEGGGQGHFQIHRSWDNGPMTVDVHWDPAALPSPNPFPADASDIAVTATPNVSFSGNSGTVTFDSGMYTIDLYFDVIDDGLPEIVENLQLVLDSPITIPAPFSVANNPDNQFALLFDATNSDWVQFRPNTAPHLWVSTEANATLSDLALEVSGVEDDWTVIWPVKELRSHLAWGFGDNNKYPTARRAGAQASTENLLGMNSTTANLVGTYTDPVYQGFPEAMIGWVTSNNGNSFPQINFNADDNDPANLVKAIRTLLNEGRTPIHNLTITGHTFQGSKSTVQYLADEFDKWASVDGNTNTWKTAIEKIGPVRGWFTYGAQVTVLTCRGHVFAESLASVALRCGSGTHVINGEAVELFTTAHANSRYLHANGANNDYNAAIDDTLHDELDDVPDELWTEEVDAFLSQPGWEHHLGTL